MKIVNKLYCVILLILCVFGCNNSESQIADLVEKWQGKQILFPENMCFVNFEGDTVCSKMPDNSKKVIVFVDSVGCVSCKLQLAKWKKFIAEIDSLSEDTIPFIFIFQTDNLKEVGLLLKQDDFSLPVCMDINGDFNRINKVPNDIRLQTFLIDESDNVSLLGNPIHNVAVRDLYIKELTDIEISEMPNTKIVTDSLQYDFGVVKINEVSRKTIVLTNLGNCEFCIKDIVTSCDCIKAEYDWNSIKPGEKAYMNILLTPDNLGNFYRTVSVYGNVKEKEIILEFWGSTQP